MTAVPAAYYSTSVFVIIVMCGVPQGAMQKGGGTVCVCV